MTLIANDFPAIARRLEQLKRERDGNEFGIPENLLILLESELSPSMPIPHCKVCLVLHERMARMSIMFVERGTSVTDFVRILMQHYSSIRMLNNREIFLSADDAQALSRHLRMLRR